MHQTLLKMTVMVMLKTVVVCVCVHVWFDFLSGIIKLLHR